MQRERAAGLWARTSLRIESGLGYAGLYPTALIGRILSAVRRLTGRPPRVVWGTTPIISAALCSDAVRRQGIPSRTVVDHVYPINDASDFDQVGWWKGERRPRDDYRELARVLLGAEVVSRFFDGGFLRLTPLAHRELQLLRLAGCRIVTTGYGMDIAMPGHQGPWEPGYQADYPHYVERAELVRHQVDEMSRHATLIIRTLQPGYLPRWDVFWAMTLAVDTDAWRPLAEDSGHDGRDGPVSVVHAPNHRTLKGTQALLDAIEQLRGEGLQIDLRLLERMPNREVREIVGSSDIVADQFVLGYQQFAIEAMSAGRPVLTRTGWWPEELRRAPMLAASPVVDANESTAAERLRELVTNPSRRRELGRRGREHALRFHSFDHVGAMWKNLFEHAWSGTPLLPDFVTRD